MIFEIRNDQRILARSRMRQELCHPGVLQHCRGVESGDGGRQPTLIANLQEGHRDRHVGGFRGAQARGNRVALGDAAAGGRHLRRSGDDGCELRPAAGPSRRGSLARAARLHERVRTLRRKHGSVGIHRDPLARHALTVSILALERRDERGHPIFRPRTDAHAVAPVRVIQRT